MNFWVPTVLLAISAVSSLVFGTLVLVRQPKRPTSRALAAVCLNLVLWSMSVMSIIWCDTVEELEFWLAAAFAVAAFLPATFYTFIAHLPGQRFQGSRVIGVGVWVLAPIFAIAAFTPYHVSDVQLIPDALPDMKHGPVFLLFNLFLAVPFFAGAVNLYRKQKRTTGLKRAQVRHALMAIYAYALLSVLTNVLAPLLGVANAQAYGPAFATLLVGWFTYAIVRYHLLDISLIISRTSIYIVTTAFTGGVFFAATSVLFWRGAGAAQESRIIAALLFGLVVAVVLLPIRDRVQLMADRLIIRRGYDLQGFVAQVSHDCAEIVSLDRLIDSVMKAIEHTMGADPVRVLLASDHDSESIDVQYCSRDGQAPAADDSYHHLLEYVYHEGKPAILEELMHAGPTERERKVIEQMRKLEAQVCVPLKSTTDYVGILLLGEKTSHDMYAKDDMVALGAIAGPMATAIENARLYRRLREANVLRAGILSSMRGGVVTVDSAGRVTLVNRTAIALFGPIELGQAIDTLPSELSDLLSRVIREKRDVRDFECVIVQPDESQAHVALSASCLTDGEGALSGAMVLVYDLTELKRLERNAERADRLSSLGTLAAGMAHEIKNPLASIRTFSQLLPRRHEDPEFLSTFSAIVPQEVDRINSIVSRLLEFARPRQTELVPTRLSVVLNKVIALIESQAEKRGARIMLNLGSGSYWIEGDEQQLVQVFLNLVLNSLAAVPEDGDGVIEIGVHAETMRFSRAGVEGPRPYECAVVSVADNGVGIPKEVIEHVFTPFFTTKEEGTGLGLSVVHGIVTEHGGIIDCRNRHDSGAVFTVSLPLVTEPARLERSRT